MIFEVYVSGRLILGISIEIRKEQFVLLIFFYPEINDLVFNFGILN